ncbi:non-ribosomal peptide synthetase [Candidatus Nitronereus thalassa]|uniref:Amino acid adenylation domain-containing protein n=1 Tax=Candidatus Nitronereus thalassa TaxID=3020898 RepID=A0ABU3K541_9BACT|nr:non-ribosomal peptide synthetase [Candidatus Nitronereus thalassa]MDT7041516.1 amino acid adenylation domain-containing protein [Candidatus Nitronereus thalassa]
MKSDNLVELLRVRAEKQGCKPLLTFLGDGEEESAHISFAQLDSQAKTIAAQLQKLELVGERVLLVFSPGLEFITAFFGCLYAGAVAVPVPLLGFRRAFSRLEAILHDAGAKSILSTKHVISKLKGQEKDAGQNSSLIWLPTDALSEDLQEHWTLPTIKEDSLAYLQYTSGSTSQPKGVMVTHGNVFHNLAYIEQGCEYTPQSILVSWLPHFHDMGLVNGILQPIFQGCRGILLSPQSFVQRPLRWLHAISHYRATHSGGPNFAYDMCANSISVEERFSLDLSTWELAYCGAEPVRHSTLSRFAKNFASQGFKWSAFCPAYGLAESTLKVSAKPKSEIPPTITVSSQALEMNQVLEVESNDPLGKALVGSGRVDFGMKVEIVDPVTLHPCISGTVGEIWVAGPSVAKGYWNREQETTHTYNAFLADRLQGPFLRTGDLGFLRDDQLFVTGRLKDLIIIRGSNFYPQDIERTVERSHESLRQGAGIAFSIEQDGEEKLVIVQELRREGKGQDTDKIVETIRRSVAEEHHLHTLAVVLVRAGTIPKTSSGKVQRQACRQAYLAGQLHVIVENRVSPSSTTEEAVHLSVHELLTLSTKDRRATIQDHLQYILARLLHQSTHNVPVHEKLVTLGLDSLMLFSLRQHIEKGFGVMVPFSLLMDEVSLNELAHEIECQINYSAADGLTVPSHQRMVQRDVSFEGTVSPGQDSPPMIPDESLSYGQQGLWILQREQPEIDVYQIRFTARVSGAFDVPAFQKAVQTLIARHSVLRTTFLETGGLLRQTVGPYHDEMFNLIDASEDSPEVFQARLEEEAYRPFDLEHGPVFRVHVFCRGDQEAILFIAVHHLVMDMWSMSILVDELRQLYVAEKHGCESSLEPVGSNYSNFVRWQADRLTGPDGERLWEYWREQLHGAIPVLPLPLDYPRASDHNVEGATHSFRLSASLTQKLHTLARQQGTTLYVVLLSALQVLLSRLSGQDDILVGSPVAGRTKSEFEPVIGYFVNILPFRARLDDNPSFASLIARNHQTVIRGLDHQDFPFPLLVERMALKRDPNVPPLCQVMLVHERPQRMTQEGFSSFILGESDARIKFGNTELTPYPLKRRSSEMDVSLIITEVNGEIQAAIQYRAALFTPARIERMARQWETLCEAMVASPTARLSEISLLSTTEQQRMIVDWNQTQTEYPKFSSIQEIFEDRVREQPDRAAVIFEGDTLTYGELNDRANQVGYSLQERGVKPGQLVGICFERSLEMIIGMLGILKAGGAYVPLDPEYPEERLRFMIEDACLEVLLTQEQFRSRLTHDALDLICLDLEWKHFERFPIANLPCTVSSEGLAYVMYTSGSTGSPKGVCIPHRGVVSLVKGTDFVQFDPDQVFLQLAPVAFDPSTFEIWGALLNGARLVLFPPHPPTFDELGRIILAHEITTMRLPTDMFHRIVETRVQVLTPLHQLIVGGDVLSASHVRKALKALPRCRLVNGYGPTENTTYTCCYGMQGNGLEENSVPIGRPIANTQVYILDAHLQPVPVGVVGELYIGGDGLALGYLQRPDLTAERFISHPLTGHSESPNDSLGARLYKTGDMACYREDGVMEFRGRVDLQVKVRGHRVELQEVEASIRQHPNIQEAIVAYKEIPRHTLAENDNSAHLNEQGFVAYVVLVEGESTLSNTTLQNFLKSKLPSHMIPVWTMVLEQLPRLPNKKVDRQALPLPDRAASQSSGLSRRPRDPIEESISEIWRDVLGLAEIRLEDNFFNLGGHSLLAIQVLSRVKSVFHVELPVRSLFENPTLEGFSARVIETQQQSHKALKHPSETVSQEGEKALSFSQERIWFLSQLDQDGRAYALPLAVRLTGPLQLQIFKASIHEIFRRHEVLRTTIQTKNGLPILLIHPFEATPLTLVDLPDIPAHEKESELQRRVKQEIQQPFDVGRGPLARITLFRFHDNDHVLFVNMHHLITDTWSLSLFFQELGALYPAFCAGLPSPLPKLAFQYTDYAHWQREWLRGGELETQLAYWTDRLANASSVLRLPTDYPRPVRQTFRGARETQALPSQLVEQIMTICRQEGVTFFMVLLAAFKVLLFRYTGQDDVLVGIPVANRRWLDAEKLIGPFVNTLVLRTDLSGDPSFRNLLARVKERTLEAYAHQDLPVERLVEALQPQRDLSRTPLFQVMFSMPNVPMPTLQLKDVSVEVLPLDRGGAQFDLTMYVPDIPGQGHEVILEYNADLFEVDTIKRMQGHYQTLLQHMIEDFDCSIGEAAMLTEAERQQLLVDWNDTVADHSSECLLQQMFESQAKRTSDRVAIVCGEVSLTYSELNQQANKVAHHLRKLGIVSESLVGIFLDRSVDMLIALLGVLKAGGAYVPLDPAYPEDRVLAMLKDSQVPLVLTQDSLLSRLPTFSSISNGSARSYAGPVVVTMSNGKWTQESSDNPDVAISSGTPAYVMYTSGSTGQPKGVLISHRALANFMHAMQHEPGLGIHDRLLAVTNLSFDISILELFLPLVVGAQVVLASRETSADGNKLNRLLEESRATVMQATPTTWQLLVQAGWMPTKGFRAFCGGEALSRALANQLLAKGVELWNLYGPTETTIWSATHRVVPGDEVVPIGHPIANTQLYILDANLHPVPIGISGELYIGGAGLALGYLNQPDLTSKNFVPNPFRKESKTKLYKTGDLTKYRSDGTIEFLGRLDSQTKIRGFRVELEEIEAVLNSHPLVQVSVVVVREQESDNHVRSYESVDQDMQLVAYLLMQDLLKPHEVANGVQHESLVEPSRMAELRDFVKKSLPDFMVPSRFVVLDKFPLTPNGKIDRHNLPHPEEPSYLPTTYVPAQNSLQGKLVQLWMKMLGVSCVGVNDNFFELGGHSLLANHMLARVFTDQGIEVSVSTFFERPTIEHLAKYIETMRWLAETQSLNPYVTSSDREDNVL